MHPYCTILFEFCALQCQPNMCSTLIYHRANTVVTLLCFFRYSLRIIHGDGGGAAAVLGCNGLAIIATLRLLCLDPERLFTPLAETSSYSAPPKG